MYLIHLLLASSILIMKPVLLLLVLTSPGAFLEGVHAFTFKSNSDSSSSNRNTRAQEQQQQPPRPSWVFPTAKTVTQKNITTTTTTTTTLSPRIVTLTTTSSTPIVHTSRNDTRNSEIYFENVSSTENEIPVGPRSEQNGTQIQGRAPQNTTEKTPIMCQQQPTLDIYARIAASPPTPSPIQNLLSDDFIMSKLCPNINDSFVLSRHRFDLDAKICSSIGQQSHCGKNMVFQSYSGSRLYGFCECDYSNQTGNVGETPLIFHKESKRCYYIYTKAFCRLDEWLELGAGGKPICTPNKCYNSGRSRRFGAPPLAATDAEPKYVPVKMPGNKTVCAKLNESNEICPKKSDVVAFRWPLQFYPSCGDSKKGLPSAPPAMLPSSRYLGAVASPDHECHPGSVLSLIGCQPSFEFD